MTWLAIVVLAVVGTAAVATFWSPFVGLLTYLWLDFMRPHDVAVELRAVRPMLIVGGLTMAVALWRERTRAWAAWKAEYPFLPLLALVAALAASAAVSVDRGVSAAIVVTAVKLSTLAWLLATLVSDDRRLRTVLWVIGLSLAVLGGGAILQAIDRHLLREFDVALVVEGPPGLHDGPFRDNNDLARVLVFAVPLWWVLAAVAPLPRRLSAGLGLAVCVFAVECTFSRSGFVGLATAVCILCVGRWPNWRGVAVFLALLGAFLVVSPHAYVVRVLTTTRPMADSSMQGRVEIWQEAVLLSLSHSILGQGPGTFEYGADGQKGVRRPAHNITLQLLFETGVVGLAAYAWLVLATLYRLLRIYSAAIDPWKSYAVGLAAALLAYLAVGQALSNPYQSPVFVIVGLAVALERPRPCRATTAS